MSLKVTLLGTGCPIPSVERSGPSQIIWADDQPILVDCGWGTVRQMVRAGIDPVKVDKVLFTHHHADHNSEYVHFVVSSWIAGRRVLTVWGPSGTTRFNSLIFNELYAGDVHFRTWLGRPPQGLTDINAVDVDAGTITDLNGFRITAARVQHDPVQVCLAYRFDGDGKSVVISGDTMPCHGLLELAKGADVLVRECTWAGEHGEKVPGMGGGIWERFGEIHSTPDRAGRLAREAGVKKLVLSHLMPIARPEDLLKACASEFAGEVIIGEDLMTIEA